MLSRLIQKGLPLSLVTTIMVAFSIYGCHDAHSGTTSTTIPESQSDIEIEIWELINEYRASNDLQSLQLDSTISEVARQHSRNMAEGNVPVGHGEFDQRVDTLRVLVGGKGFAENVAAGYPTAEAVVDGWVGSSGHRQNIVGNYNLTGIGVAYADDGTPYYTQVFVLK